jgi:ATP-dependent Lon protease
MANKPQALTLPLLITRALVVFPGTQQVIEAGRDFSISAVTASKEECDSLILVTSQKQMSTENPKGEDVYEEGVLCHIISISERDNRLKARLEVVERVKLSDIKFEENAGYYSAIGGMDPLPSLSPVENEAIIKAVNKALEGVPNVFSTMPKNIANIVLKSQSAIAVCYNLASYLEASTDTKQKILECADPNALMEKVLILLNGESQRNQIERDISETVRESSEKAQREYFLREKLKAIKHELGEDNDGANDPDSILEKLEKNPYPENIKAKVKAELKKYEMMPQGSLEAALIQSYLDVLLNVPWWQKN